MSSIHPHFLLVSVGAQGHINPSRQLARHLSHFTGARVTIAVPTAAFRRMFPNDEDPEQPDELAKDHVFYTHYSDGSDLGLNPSTDLHKIRAHIVSSLISLADSLSARGRPVTCVVYALLLSMVAEAARVIGIPAVLFWIQPAAVFAMYHRYFGGYDRLVDEHVNDPDFLIEFPGMIPVKIKDLPSFLTIPDTNDPYYFLFSLLRDVFCVLRSEIDSGKKPLVLVNSFEELECEVLGSIDDVDMFTVGPLVSRVSGGHDLFAHDTSDYVAWLDGKDDRSVAYVSFGSLSVLSETQMEELRSGLKASGFAYLWVVRKDSNSRVVDEDDRGMIVEWCDQVTVLSHRAVGCFLTHCGWNSMTESIVCGVPMVMMPQWTDQRPNARLAEGIWGNGVVAEAGEDGLVSGEEVRRCLEVVMRGGAIREKAAMWREKAREVGKEGGSSVANIRSFVERI